MPWTAERSTVNQRVQTGVESTPGTAVAAAKLLECFNFKFGVKADVKMFTATGRKYPQTQEENLEWVGGSVDGKMDYNGMPYLLASVFGLITPAAHGTSSVAKDWIVTPPVTGSVQPQTYTFEQGDAVRAHKFAYGLLTKFGYQFTRKEASCSGDLIGQLLSDGITMTGSPTAVALASIVGKHFNVYCDLTSAGLGVTQLNKVLSVDYSCDGLYGQFWPVSRANASFANHVDLAPKSIMKLLLAADSSGMAFLPYMQNGTTLFVRNEAQGSVIDNNQTVALGGPSAGTFTLTYKGQTTTAIAFNATGATVQTAFLLLSTVGSGNATVTGGASGPYTVTFTGTLASDTTAMTGSGASLTGGAFLITQTQAYNKFVHDMAVKVSNPADFSDSDGVFATEFELTVVEDSTWTKAQTFTVTNLITAL